MARRWIPLIVSTCFRIYNWNERLKLHYGLVIIILINLFDRKLFRVFSSKSHRRLLLLDWLKKCSPLFPTSSPVRKILATPLLVNAVLLGQCTRGRAGFYILRVPTAVGPTNFSVKFIPVITATSSCILNDRDRIPYVFIIYNIIRSPKLLYIII